MINALRGAFLYAEKRARDIVFRAVESVLADGNGRGGPLIVSRMTREAATRARAAAQVAGFEFNNWYTAARAVVNAMLRATVLLTRERTPIPVGITAQATEVAALDLDYVDATEAFLIEFLVRELRDVTTRDHTALAHALFRQFDRNVPMEDFEDRVVMLLAKLARRVTLDDTGTYIARESQLQPSRL